jgi:hypothetical protein
MKGNADREKKYYRGQSKEELYDEYGWNNGKRKDT